VHSPMTNVNPGTSFSGRDLHKWLSAVNLISWLP
jgi:hypothetical protein